MIGNNLYFKSTKRIILKISVLLIKVRKSYSREIGVQQTAFITLADAIAVVHRARVVGNKRFTSIVGKAAGSGLTSHVIHAHKKAGSNNLI